MRKSVVLALLLAAALAAPPVCGRKLLQNDVVDSLAERASTATRKLAAALAVPPPTTLKLAAALAVPPPPTTRKLAQTYYLLSGPATQAAPSPPAYDPFNVLPKAPGLLPAGDIRYDTNVMQNFLHPLSDSGYGGSGAQPTGFGRR
jgi:hypothetical protein